MLTWRLALVLFICLCGGFAEAFNYGRFITKPSRVIETQAASHIVINSLSFGKKSWSEDFPTSFVMHINLLRDKRNVSCRYQLVQTQAASQDVTRFFDATLAMSLDKKGEVKKSDWQQYCKDSIIVKQVQLHALHKNLLGIDIAFSNNNHYKAVLHQGRFFPKQVLSSHVHSAIAPDFNLKVLPDSAFSRFSRIVVWGQPSVISNETQPPINHISLAAAGNIQASEGQYSGLITLRDSSSREMCAVTIQKGTIHDNGNLLRFDGNWSSSNSKCSALIESLDKISFYALSEEQLGVEVSFKNNSWYRATFPHIRGAKLQPVLADNDAEYSDLFHQEKYEEAPESPPPAKQKSTPQTLTEEEFWALESWNTMLWESTSESPRKRVFKRDHYKIIVTNTSQENGRRLSPLNKRFSLRVTNTALAVDLDFNGHCTSEAQMYLSFYKNLDDYEYTEEYIPEKPLRRFYKTHNVEDLPDIVTLLNYAHRAINTLCKQTSLTKIRLLVKHKEYPGLRVPYHTVSVGKVTLSSLPVIGGTYTKDAKPELTNRFQAMGEDAQLPVRFYTSYGGFKVNHIGRCESEPIIGVTMEQQYTQQAQPKYVFAESQFRNIASALGELYAYYCPRASKINVSFSEQPKNTYCPLSSCKQLIADRQNKWRVVQVPWEELDYSYDYLSLMHFFHKGKLYQLNATNRFFSRFYVSFFEAYSELCYSSIKNPMKTDTSFTHVEYEDDIAVSKRAIGTFTVYTEKEYGNLFAKHWANTGYSGEQRYTSWVNGAGGIQQIQRFIKKHGCDSDVLQTVSHNIVQKARLIE
ncbi:hypothetical protein AltI4_37130 [Alteromonas sp. I4]|nr:hypothetical protein AltI4_37130 [Alteromonas sp. I4]